MTVAEKVKQAAAMKAFDYIGKDPDKNLPKVMDAIAKLDESDSIANRWPQSMDILWIRRATGDSSF